MRRFDFRPSSTLILLPFHTVHQNTYKAQCGFPGQQAAHLPLNFSPAYLFYDE